MSTDSKSRTLSVVALKIAGASFETIAEQLGYGSAQAAQVAYEKALASSVDEYGDIPRLRDLQSRRLDRLLQAAFPRALNPRDPDQATFMGKSLEIISRMNKMHGVDQPTQVQITTPEFERLQEWVVATARRLEVEDVVEAEIIEDDVLELESGG